MDDTVTVATLLSAAGLRLPPDELAEITSSYPGIRASIELLYGEAFTDADPFLVPAIAIPPAVAE